MRLSQSNSRRTNLKCSTWVSSDKSGCNASYTNNAEQVNVFEELGSLRSKRFQSSYCAKVRAGAKKKKKFNPAGEISHNFIKCRFSGQNPAAVISGTWLPGYPSIKSVKTISAVQGADMIQGPVVLSPSYSTYQ